MWATSRALTHNKQSVPKKAFQNVQQTAINHPMSETDTASDDTNTASLLSRFGQNAGKHGPVSEQRVACLVRISRDANLRAVRLARALGMRKSAWMAQAIDLMSDCEPGNWFPAVARFQQSAHLKRRGYWKQD